MAERRKLHKSQEYIQGNTVRKLQPDRVPERRPSRERQENSFATTCLWYLQDSNYAINVILSSAFWRLLPRSGVSKTIFL